MDGVTHGCEPDNCAICHVVMSANNTICSVFRPLGVSHLMKHLESKVWILLESKTNLHSAADNSS